LVFDLREIGLRRGFIQRRNEIEKFPDECLGLFQKSGVARIEFRERHLFHTPGDL
jgi:hypothetical protein